MTNGNGGKPFDDVEMGKDLVGWTNDGMVFMIVWTKIDRKTINEIGDSTFQGESIPLKTVMQWDSNRAREIMKAIETACDEVERKGVANG